MTTRKVPMPVVPALGEHPEFIAALRRRDETAVVASIQDHIENSRQRVVRELLVGGAPGQANSFAMDMGDL